MSEALRNRLLNVFLTSGPRVWYNNVQGLADFARLVIGDFFAEDLQAHMNRTALQRVRSHFAHGAWNEVYDLLQFALRCPFQHWLHGKSGVYINACNEVLKEEHAGYRFVEGVIVQVTSDAEIAAIETALASPDEVARAHIRKALELFAARENPNYGKVIQESISGVEALLRSKSGESGFSNGVKKLLGQNEDFHPALLGAIDKIHGWSSDAKAIRHAGKDGDSAPDLALARFMLVWCSAFMGYVQEPRS